MHGAVIVNPSSKGGTPLYRRISLSLLTAMVLLSAPLASPVAAANTPTGSLNKLQHIVVIYQENWSFDSLFPDFPGANGINNATTPQVDKQSSLPGVKSWTLSVVSAQHSRALAVASQTTNTSYSR